VAGSCCCRRAWQCDCALLGTSNIKQGLGAIGYLTGGLIPREAAFFDCFSRALGPLLHPDLYREEP
jgi:non-canonical (house-cleaning) NTP pyrophosphatase